MWPKAKPSVPSDPQTDPGGWNQDQALPRANLDSIALALSGGGHRATLFALGGVAAVVDAGLWPNVRWVSSASGGSFANAAVALGLRRSASQDAIDKVLRGALESVSSRFSLLRSPRPRFSKSAGGLVGGSYEAGINRTWLASPEDSRPNLGRLGTSTRSHVFLAVDLVTLQPVFLSDRAVFAPGLDDERDVLHLPGALKLDRVVRASAAFPMTPATRIQRSDLGLGIEPMYRDMLLADGGLWNNLATSWLGPNQVLGNRFRSELDLTGLSDRVGLVLVMDASAPPRRSEWKARRRWWDRPLLTGLRSFEVSQQSTVTAYRSLAAGSSPPPIVRLVDISQVPADVQPRGVLLGGASRDDWAEVRDHNVSVGTIGPTATRIQEQVAINVMAHGYAGAAAHLTTLGVPFHHFSVPHERVRRVLTV